jgi:hypothetical protein
LNFDHLYNGLCAGSGELSNLDEQVLASMNNEHGFLERWGEDEPLTIDVPH